MTDTKDIENALKKVLDDRRDWYRPAIHFLAGILGFCLAIMVGIFSAYHNYKDEEFAKVLDELLSGMVLTAAVAAVALFIVQSMKLCRVKDSTGAKVIVIALMAITVGSGLWAACPLIRTW